MTLTDYTRDYINRLHEEITLTDYIRITLACVSLTTPTRVSRFPNMLVARVYCHSQETLRLLEQSLAISSLRRQMHITCTNHEGRIKLRGRRINSLNKVNTIATRWPILNSLTH